MYSIFSDMRKQLAPERLALWRMTCRATRSNLRPSAQLTARKYTAPPNGLGQPTRRERDRAQVARPTGDEEHRRVGERRIAQRCSAHHRIASGSEAARGQPRLVLRCYPPAGRWGVTDSGQHSAEVLRGPTSSIRRQEAVATQPACALDRMQRGTPPRSAGGDTQSSRALDLHLRASVAEAVVIDGCSQSVPNRVVRVQQSELLAEVHIIATGEQRERYTLGPVEKPNRRLLL